MNARSEFDVDIAHIRNHYDRLSFWYRMLWGEHIHHGYWEDNESIATAQIKLMERLAEKAGIPKGVNVLDIGCGLGGSAFWLAEQYKCRVTGLTISPVQARMATKKATAIGLCDQVQFQVADINLWQPQPESFDVIWIMEGSEHFRDQEGFYERCAVALNPGGILATCAWLRGDRPLSGEDEELITTIGHAMLSASLNTLSQHKAWMRDAGLNVETAQDITQKVAPTWDYCSRLAGRLPLRCLLPFVDSFSRRFVRSFPLMKRAYAEGIMAFGLFVAKKCNTKSS
jgi:tocopherol O-methyltransferase